ncbi:MAG TPA: glycosyltransferase family 87 protein [Gemmataceae bacterium]|jgi:hypothetical protein|nr:glycosyltransferase family 87 protein [Gemmataceae bacterium]
MIIRLRPALVLAALAILVLCLLPSWGFFSRLAFLGAIVTLGLTLSALFVPEREWRIFDRPKNAVLPDGTATLLILLTWLITILAIFSTGLTYEDAPEYSLWLLAMAWVGCLIAAVIIVFRMPPLLYPQLETRSQRSVFALAVVLAVGFALRAIVLYASPNPVIDVYSWLRDSSTQVLHGRNPYSEEIQTPYGTKRAAHYGVREPADARPPAYPPLPILLCLPFRALGLDVRWANIVGDLMAGVALFGVAAHRGRPSFGLICACLFLNLPRSVWIIEQAWYEPMLAGLFGLGFWLIEYEGARRWLGFVLLALGLTGKQFGLPLLFPLAWSQRRHWRMLLAGLIVAGLVMLPWLVWSPHDFFDVILFKHLHRPPQFHSLTVVSACAQIFGVYPLRMVNWAIAVGLILAISWRTPQQGAAAALGVGTALFVFCIFHTQGFPNYFYLCEYLWLLGMIGMFSERPFEFPAKLQPRRFAVR